MPANTPALNYSVLPFSATMGQVPIETSAYRYNVNGIQVQDLFDMGLDPITTLEIVAKQGGPVPMFMGGRFFNSMRGRTKGVRNYRGRRRLGKKFLQNGVVLGTVTANATGLTQVELEVSPNETRQNGRSFGTNERIQANSGRWFNVESETLNANGRQRIVVKPLDGVYNLQVVGSQSLDFPTNSYIGRAGQTVAPGCEQSFYQTFVTEDVFLSYQMTSMVAHHTINQSTVQNEINIGRFKPFWLQLNSPDVPPNERMGIGALLTRQRMQTYSTLVQQFNWSQLFAEGNMDPSIAALAGHGAKYQIPRSNWRSYVPGQFSNPLYLQRLLRDYKYGNEDFDTNNRLTFLMGPELYSDVQAGLGVSSNNNLVRWADANRTKADVERKFMAGPDQFDGYVDYFGYEINFELMNGLWNPSFQSRRSPVNQNIGIEAHSGFIFDENPLRNQNEETGEYQATGTYKLNMYVPLTMDNRMDAFRSVYLTGRIDENGNVISSGSVTRLADTTINEMVVNGCLELADPQAHLYIHI